MLARLSAFVIWALVAATAVFWGLRLWVRAPAAPTYTVAVGEATAVRGDLTRLLGAAPVATAAAPIAPEAASRFRLLGIMAPKGPVGSAPAAHGVALIAVDGKMPKAYPVGARVDGGDLVLQSVSLRTALIAPSKGGAQVITLELPPLAAAATGTLPAGGTSAGGGYVPPPMPMPAAAPVPPYVPQPTLPQPGVVPTIPAQPMQMPVPPRPESNAPTQ